jgi:hypothetical protein
MQKSAWHLAILCIVLLCCSIILSVFCGFGPFFSKNLKVPSEPISTRKLQKKQDSRTAWLVIRNGMNPHTSQQRPTLATSAPLVSKVIKQVLNDAVQVLHDVIFELTAFALLQSGFRCSFEKAKNKTIRDEFKVRPAWNSTVVSSQVYLDVVYLMILHNN